MTLLPIQAGRCRRCGGHVGTRLESWFCDGCTPDVHTHTNPASVVLIAHRLGIPVYRTARGGVPERIDP